MNTKCFALAFLCVSILLHSQTSHGAEAADIVINDFEGSGWGDWKTTGDAFGTGPTQADLATKLDLMGFNGNGVCTTKVNGDRPIGTLTSPPFEISRHFISFLIAGGSYERDTCMNLLIDGEIVHSATGANNIHLEPASWMCPS